MSQRADTLLSKALLWGMEMDGLSSAIVDAAVQMQQAQLQQQVQLAVLKKAMDTQAATGLALIQALPSSPALETSGNIGTRLNVFA
ncbi:MAG TPA: putative motility protein [Aquimonas sp.]|nr:putative motility protein [Aquimonas sp.]HRF52855.1 putative motility protein [Aquimonas sp.]